MKEEKTMHKERINYVIDGDVIVGKSVNLPGVIIQAKNMEEFKRKAKALCQMWVNHFNELMAQDEPFEFVQQELPDYDNPTK